MKEVLKFINDYQKINGFEPSIELIKSKIRDLIKEENSKTKSKSSSKIYFRDCKWSDYQVLRKELSSDEKFVKEYAGVDLKAYIQDALKWSEDGNTTTELGWFLTLKTWMRRAKNSGSLMMLPKVETKSGHINY